MMVLTAACGGGNQAPVSTTEAPAAAAAVDPATAGSITGKVMLEGTAPKNEPIKMNADPVCVQQNKGPQAQETYMVGSGG
ncbi:MAG: hypothetical protein HYZ58_13160, partial [Acidobacteria bacterium]|nr:hypothetical protein [Acidobacteriota bacterium]